MENLKKKTVGDVPEVQTSVVWSPETVLRPPFSWIAAAGKRTSNISQKIDRPVSMGLDMANAYVWRPACHVTNRVQKMPVWQSVPLGLFLGGLALAVLISILLFGGFLAVLFLPVTALVTVAGVALLTVVAPVALLVGWLVVCTPSFTRRIVQPTLAKIVSTPAGMKVLLAQ